jgi:diguanylate cyclase (GGDEF)-like protein
MAELRAHRRLAVDFDAFVTAAGLRDHPCKVRDFCLGGVLLSFEDPLRQPPAALGLLERGDALELRVVTRSPGFRDTYTFAASIARRDRSQLGVAFTSPDPTSLMALQSLATVNASQLRMGNRPDTRKKARPDDATVRSVMAELRSRVEEIIAPLPERLLAAARESLETMARAAGNDDERNRITDCFALLRRHANNLQVAFLQQSLKPLLEFDKWQTGSVIPSASNTYRLSLIEKGAFEDWLAIKVMVSRAESECQESLFKLHIRLNELLGTTLAVQSNPVGPSVFFHAFGEPLQKLRLHKPVEQTLMRTLETLLLECLGQLYPRLNEILSARGLLPELELGRYMRAFTAEQPAGASGRGGGRVGGSAGGTPPQAGAASASAANGGLVAPDAGAALSSGASARPEAADDVAPSAETREQSRAVLALRQFEMQQRIARHSWQTVQRLLVAGQPPMPAPMAGAGVETTPSPAAIDSAMPATAAPAASSQSTDSLLPVLDALPPADAGALSLQQRILDVIGRRLPPAQAAAVDTVDELFARLLASSLLREETRALLRRLDAPYLKIVLTDPAFLADEKHPARQVLNRLAVLGARGAMTTAQQQARINTVVAELSAGAGEPEAFPRALAALDELLAQQQRVYEHNLRRVKETVAGKQRLADARKRISEVIEELVGGRRVPRALLTLLDCGWRESMISTCLRCGAESDELKAQLDVMQQMMHGIEDPSAIDMKAMLGAIKRGLASQAHSQLNREAVVSDLRVMFTALKDGKPEEVPSVDMPVGAVLAAEVPPPQEDSHTLARWLKRARELDVGDWVAFHADAAAEAHQARIAWRDADRNLFVFVNLHGMKVDELDVDSLARALRDKRAWRIEDPQTPFVDRGLEAMVQKVYGQLAHRATHDELTGLLNRKEFERRLQRHVLDMKGDSTWLLCWLDLDQFKVINSTCGFEAGDRLITDVAHAIAETVGEGGLVARLGGDEFAILTEAGADNGRPVGHIIEAIDALRFHWQDKTFPVGASAGVVLITGPDASSEELMKFAETACYAAKEAGRNRVQVFQADDVQLARRDDIIRWVSRLNQAIENDRLQLRCQLIRPVDPQSGLLPHYEILIAIEDENGEFIPPSSFMQAAERYNRMHAVDHWVIRNVLQWMHDNPAVMSGISGFSINLSGQSLNDAKLTSYILREVMDSAVAREKVTFEVTETAAIANLADAVDFIRELQAIGCKFSLDDFGSGLSSYSYLKNLPVDYVKIDGAFIRDIHRSPSDYMMVRSINEMAHFMGKRTIAEYVESDEILVKLREIGVDFAQGYGIERPRPLDTLKG